MICCIYIANRITNDQIVHFLNSAINLPQQIPLNAGENNEDKVSQTISHPEEENETCKIPRTWISDMHSKSFADQQSIDLLLAQYIKSETKKKILKEEEKQGTTKTQGSPEAGTDPNSDYIRNIYELSTFLRKQAHTEDDSSSFSAFMQHYTEQLKNGQCAQIHKQIATHFTAALESDKVKKMEKNEENAKSSDDEGS